MNKLDAFNNDKFKCPKCKEYFDVNNGYQLIIISLTLCGYCDRKWVQYCISSGQSALSPGIYLKSFNSSLALTSFEEWCNN
jgi:hypothetical protein